jgi:predicted phage tail protein
VRYLWAGNIEPTETIAQYCDGLVPDGFGGTEPRYTFNATITDRQEAFKLLQQITSVFRGMAYWSLGQVFVTADMPADPIKLVAPANIIGGAVEYSGTALKANHSVAIVHWNDPADFYRPAIEVVIDDDQLARFDWREMQINLLGTTTRGTAHRYGKWALDSEKSQLETASFPLSWDQFTVSSGVGVQPGQIISLADPRKAAVRLGGRIAAVGAAHYYTLDSAFTPTIGQTYNLIAEMPDGSIASEAISAFTGAVVNLTTDFSTRPQLGAMWVITGTDIEPRQYRTLAIRENAKNSFQITALFHDPTKYDRVELGFSLDSVPYTMPKSTIEPVSIGRRFPAGIAANSRRQKQRKTRGSITFVFAPQPSNARKTLKSPEMQLQNYGAKDMVHK